MSAGRLHAEFVASGGGRVLVTARLASSRSPGVLVAPAFAEEMNKSRRMVTELALALAERGWSTVVVDLFGTGDSEGEFGDSTLERWCADLIAARQWSAQHGVDIRALLGVRFGCLLAAELARRGAIGVQRTMFWQPVIDGTRMLDQFLRLRVAAQMIGDGAKETIGGLRERLKSSRLEIAGYELSPELVSGIDGLKLGQGAAALGAIDWMEVMRSVDTPVGATSMRAIDALKAGGSDVSLQTTTGDPFWTSTEIVTSPALVAASVEKLCLAA